MSADHQQHVQDRDRAAAPPVPGDNSSGSPAAAADGSASTTTIEDQRRLRREARQKRILASGKNRLNQITATFSGVQLPPAAEGAAAPTRNAEVPRAEATSAGEQPRGSGAGARVASVRRTAGELGDNESDSKRFPPGGPWPEPPHSEQHYAQLAGLRRRSRDREGDGDENEDEDGLGRRPDFFAHQNEGFEQMFAQLLRQQGEGGSPEQQQQQWQGLSAKSQETRLRERRNTARWKAAHFLGVVGLVLYVIYVEFFTRPGGASVAWRRFAFLATQAPDAALPSERISMVPFFWYLGTMEAMLLSGQLLLQGPLSEGPLPSSIAQFAALNQVFNLVTRYSMIWSALANDIFTTVFCFGFVVGVAAFCESSGSDQR